MWLNLVDIYCGAGGLSDGFAQARIQLDDEREARFRVVYGVDRDRDCILSFRRNHFPRMSTEEQERVAPCRSVVGLAGDEIRFAAGLDSIDVLVGGPNCQGVSAAGLRNPDDKRNEMFRQFHRLVQELQPLWFIMENVPGLVHINNRDLLLAILETFEDMGYRTAAEVLLAADFGVAQLRYRLFVVGNRIGAPIRFPYPTHRSPHNRRRATGQQALPIRPTYRTVRDAIGDLERFVPAVGLQTGQDAQTDGCPPNHVVYTLEEENLARINVVGQGQDWRVIPIELLPDRYFATRASDQVGTYGRLSWDAPAYTITASAANVTAGMFTHPTRNRPISAREAARLQSFDDSYVFEGRVESLYRQIGNAVPPLLAKALAVSILGCHYLPERAESWGREGRVTLDLLRWRDARVRWPVLTPRHPLEVRWRTAPTTKRETTAQSAPRISAFAADPAARAPVDQAELQRLRVEAKFPRNLRATRRAKAILAYFDGKSLETITSEARVSTETIEKWVNGFYQGGVEGWRAQHTSIARLAGDDVNLRIRLEDAISQVRTRRQRLRRITVNGSAEKSKLLRSYMNRHLHQLIRRFQGHSVTQLLALAEKLLGRGVGTVYVGDLLAICAVLEDYAKSRTNDVSHGSPEPNGTAPVVRLTAKDSQHVLSNEEAAASSIAR